MRIKAYNNKAIYPYYKPKYHITRRQAKQIRFWRIVAGYSWGAVAREISRIYPELCIRESGVIGANLCSDAMVLLNERLEKGWN